MCPSFRPTAKPKRDSSLTGLGFKGWHGTHHGACCGKLTNELLPSLLSRQPYNLQCPARQRSTWYRRQGLFLFWQTVVCPLAGESTSTAAAGIPTGFAGGSLEQRLMFPPQKLICLPLERCCSPSVAAASSSSCQHSLLL